MGLGGEGVYRTTQARKKSDESFVKAASLVLYLEPGRVAELTVSLGSPGHGHRHATVLAYIVIMDEGAGIAVLAKPRAGVPAEDWRLRRRGRWAKGRVGGK